MATIEERLKQLPSNKCRICEHYIRVNFEGYRNVVNRQGFCLLGQLDGEYSLYLSSSASGNCMGFILNEKNLAITEAEHQLDMEEKQYLDALRDKRTANYKEAKPLLEAYTEYSEKTGTHKGLAWMDAEMHLRKIGCERFHEINKDRIIELRNMVTLNKSDYSKFLAQLSIEIHDRFCKCDKLEFKEKSPERPKATIEQWKPNLN